MHLNRLSMNASVQRFFRPRSRGAAAFGTLLIADHDNKVASRGTLSALTAARKLGGNVEVLIAGHKCQTVCEQLSVYKGVAKLIHVDNPLLERPMTATANVITELQQKEKYDHIFAPVSSAMRDVVPRVAAVLDLQPMSDVIGIEDECTFIRPTYAGNAVTKVVSSDSTKIVLVRPTAFEPASETTAPVTATPLDIPVRETGGQTWLSDEFNVSEKPQLGSSNTVVSGGRALQTAEAFEEILNPLCSALNAAMGATRAAVDGGLVPNDMQIGQTGKVVAPKLYFAIGISGAIQHIAGMKDSKVVVAINKDAEAPIFKVADYGLVGDLFKIIPEITNTLVSKNLKVE